MSRTTQYQQAKIWWLFCSCILLLLQGVCFGMDLPLTVIDHEGIDFFVSGYPLLLAARIENAVGIDQARCYFRYDPLEQYVFVEATPGKDGSYTCVLPPPDGEVIGLDYFFLVLDARSRIIRSKTYSPTKNDVAAERRQSVSLPSDFVVHVEADDTVSVKEESLFGEEVEFVTVEPARRYGYYVDVYPVTGRDSRSATGYFGGYFFDADRKTCFPIKGVSPFLDLSKAAGGERREVRGEADRRHLEAGIVGPDISGDDWSGMYYTTGMNNRERLTARIIVTPWTSNYSKVDIITSKTGLGHSFTRGWMDAGGNMLIYDDYDGEDWSTHWGPATATRLRILDFIYPPTAGDPNPPKNVISLKREAPPPEPEPEPEKPRLDFLPAILNLFMLHTGAVQD